MKRRFLVLVGIVFLAALLRGWAALRLPVDYDEPTYLDAGAEYARALGAGDLNGVIDNPLVREHPALVKLLYGVVILGAGEGATWTVDLYAGRLLSATFGVLAAFVLALASPLAGALLAVHTMAVKYTSQVYLEALPLLASLAAVLAMAKGGKRQGAGGGPGQETSPGGEGLPGRCAPRSDIWFWASAILLGVTAAGKFTYLPVVIPILYLAIFERRTRWHHLLLYSGVAIAAFWLLNPTLWRHPLSRLFDALTFHVRYSQGANVQVAGLPWYQPLVWISRSPPSEWHPDVFFYFGLDGVIFLLALAGLYWEWRERRWVVVWIASGLLFLLLWPTKWPQYTLVLVPALCLSAATAVGRAYEWLREQETYWEWFRQMVPKPPLAFWIGLGAIVLGIAVLYTATTLQLTLGRLNWSHLTQAGSLLPSDIVYSMAAGPDDMMVLATAHGVALWSPPEAADLPDRWVIYTAENSPLPHNSVRAVALGCPGQGSHVGQDEESCPLWFGTEGGLASYDRGRWQTYEGAEMGLPADAIYALALGSDGRVWVGTGSGAATFDGRRWTAFTATSSGLGHNRVLALAVESRAEGDRVWFGTRAGVSRLDAASGEWVNFPGVFSPEWGGVAALLVDSAGRVWAGTVGGGLGVWDGTSWQFYRSGTSGLPFNTVTALAEVRPGVLWVGTAPPAEAGGQLAEFDGEHWKAFDPHTSGFSGGEPMAFAQDAEGRWWIGTRTAGVDIYHGKK